MAKGISHHRESSSVIRTYCLPFQWLPNWSPDSNEVYFYCLNICFEEVEHNLRGPELSGVAGSPLQLYLSMCLLYNKLKRLKWKVCKVNSSPNIFPCIMTSNCHPLIQYFSQIQFWNYNVELALTTEKKGVSSICLF